MVSTRFRLDWPMIRLTIKLKQFDLIAELTLLNMARIWLSFCGWVSLCVSLCVFVCLWGDRCQHSFTNDRRWLINRFSNHRCFQFFTFQFHCGWKEVAGGSLFPFGYRQRRQSRPHYELQSGFNPSSITAISVALQSIESHWSSATDRVTLERHWPHESVIDLEMFGNARPFRHK